VEPTREKFLSLFKKSNACFILQQPPCACKSSKLWRCGAMTAGNVDPIPADVFASPTKSRLAD